MKRLIVIPFLMLTSIASASPYVRSDPTDHDPAPTGCNFYFDGAQIAETKDVLLDDEGYPMCNFDTSSIQPGTHTVVASFVIDNGPWGTEEGPLSDPLDFTKPESGSGLPAPVLHLETGDGIVIE